MDPAIAKEIHEKPSFTYKLIVFFRKAQLISHLYSTLLVMLSCKIGNHC